MRRRIFALVLFLTAMLAHGAAQRSAPEVAIKITSPLGRTGTVTRVRVVAQISVPQDVTLSPVEFFVDGEKIGTVDSGPPYVVDWTDSNPFEAREIVVQASDSLGRTARDVVKLPAFEVEEKTEVKAVLLETGVYDKLGNVINNVAPDSFSVFEDNVQQTIDLVTKENVPTDIVLLVDNSRSMAFRMDFVRHAAERIFGSLRKNDRAIVAPFNEHVGTITGPTNDPTTISQAIAAMKSSGGTALLDSVIDAAHLVRANDRRGILVLITDGFDENSKATIADAKKAVQESQATVYAVGIGGAAGISLHGQDTLREITGVSGGRAFFPPREQDVLLATEAIASDTRNRFLVTYTPTNQKKDGKWRSIAVKVPGDYRVRTREGYFAPMPAPIRPTMEFTVLDEGRRYVDVTADDLAVYEDGELQKIETFQEAVDPVSIVLALDSSGSMKKNTDLVKETAREFVMAVRPEDSLAMITFADRPKFAHALGTERQWSLDAIEKYDAIGGTALYDALWNSFATLKGAKGRRAVVVLSDGKDEDNPGKAPGSIHKLEETLAFGREVGATVFAIGLGPGADRPTLERIAEESGGQTYYALDGGDLSGQFKRVVGDLRRRYVLGYTSTDSTHDGSWRTVEIRPKAASHYVLSDGGYFAPSD